MILMRGKIMLSKYEIKNLNISEKFLYENLIEQIENDDKIDWGENINAIIISDRCKGRSAGLYKYLNTKTKINVYYLNNFEDFIFSCDFIPHIVILIGYQKNEENYKIVNFARNLNPKVFITLFAYIDELVRNLCMVYKIECFNSFKPAKDFVNYLKCSLV